MTPTPISATMPSLPHLRTLLKTFTSSSSRLQIITSHPPSPTPPPSPQRLHVLDSSFNPPTLAHFSLCTSALFADRANSGDGQRQRLLLLLAIQNADKAPQPASLEQRLAMMGVFAQELVAGMRASRQRQSRGVDQGLEDPNERSPSESSDASLTVDVGITKDPYFLDKASAISSLPFYNPHPTSGNGPEQIHLIGFDTLVRLLSPRYYPPSHTLSPLAPLFAQHRVRVTRRRTTTAPNNTEEEQAAERKEQDVYLAALARGEREHEGGKREWAERIEMVEGEEVGEGVSSSGVREGVGRDDGEEGWRRWVTAGAGEWVVGQGLYRDEEG